MEDADGGEWGGIGIGAGIDDVIAGNAIPIEVSDGKVGNGPFLPGCHLLSDRGAAAHQRFAVHKCRRQHDLPGLDCRAGFLHGSEDEGVRLHVNIASREGREAADLVQQGTGGALEADILPG